MALRVRRPRTARLADPAVVTRAPAAVARAGSSAQARVLDALWPLVQAALAAGIAWYVAHDLLGHPQPFFAPIAAAISLSTSPIQRSRRVAQMLVGVLLGIGIAEVLHGPLGDSPVALGTIVFITMALTVALGAGFFGDGMMFPNQAAASAVLVVTLHRHGTGAERALDALVGGATAFIVGVGLFPAEPLSLLRAAEGRVLATLARRLGTVAARLGAGQWPEPEWLLEAGHAIHQRLSALARARATARVNVRVAPRRFGRRRAVDAEVLRTGHLDLLANAVIGLIRSVAPPGDGALPDPALVHEITVLAGALRWLAESERPWPDTVLREVAAAARAALAYADARGLDRDDTTTAILRAAATDLLAVIAPRGVSDSSALAQ